MPAIKSNLLIQADSYEPHYWQFTDPDTGQPVDLTASGYQAFGSFATTPDDNAQTLLELSDSDFERTSTGRVYYAPSADESLWWEFRRGYYQFYLTSPTGQPVRFAEGRFFVSPKV